MQHFYKIKKGFNLKLEGEASQVLENLEMSSEYGIRPDDFYGIAPKLLVKEGDEVKVGSPLFTDKFSQQINVVSPISGKVSKIERGERRKILFIHLSPDFKQTQKEFEKINYKSASANAIIHKLNEVGLLSFFKQRPYDITLTSTEIPRNIFVSTFNKMPLAANFSYISKDEREALKIGLEVLSKIAPTYVGISKEQSSISELLKDSDVHCTIFEGPNPSGNVSVHINHIDPINKGELVWTINPEEVLFIGRYFSKNTLDFSKKIALAGSQVKDPHYLNLIIGASLQPILKEQLISDAHTRIIDGNPLVGRKISATDFLGAHTKEICVLPEGDNVSEPFGWIMPRFKDFSMHRSYFSWIFGKNRTYNLDCRIKGGKRHMIMSGEYDSVFPMDIYPEQLIKAIITGNIDKQEELGIYEVAPEDFALAEFIDSSKLELQRIVREGLDILRKENA